MPLNGTKLTLTVTGDLVLSDGFVEGHAAMNKIYSTILANGVGAGQADRRYHKTRTLAASATEDLDLAGVLTDVYGAVLTFTRVKALIVAAAAANANNVIVGGAAATQFLSWVGAATHTVTVRPGATLALIAGVADSVGYVAGAGADFLRIGNGGAGTSVTYDITVIGCSA